jgi:hypothetical protein
MVSCVNSGPFPPTWASLRNNSTLREFEEGKLLTDKQREQIRAEEIFRAEVQRELKIPEERSRKARAWRFFNTALGLWVLSSLVLGGLTAGFGYLQNHLATLRRNRELVDRDSEQFAVRLEYSQLLLKSALDSDAKPNANAMDIKRSIYQGSLHAFLEDTSETRLFPESKDRSTLSLVFELKAKDKTMPETGDHSYRAALDHVSELMELRNKLNSPSYTNLSEEQRVQLFKSIDAMVHEIDLM